MTRAELHPQSSTEQFCNPDVHVQSWYIALRSRNLKVGAAVSVNLLDRRFTLYRGESGKVYAVDAACPHLGADLGHAQVIGENIRCAFHGRCFGIRSSKPSNSKELFPYPCQERWGFVWIYNGTEPAFDLPNVDEHICKYRLPLPRQKISCHPHLVLGNGLDTEHFEVLHGMEFVEPPRLDSPQPFSLRLSLAGIPRSKVLRRLLCTSGTPLGGTFATFGGSLALFESHGRDAFSVLFTGQSESQSCNTQTIVFFSSLSPAHIGRTLLTMSFFLHADRKILNSIQFTPNFTQKDANMVAYRDLINGMSIG